MTREEELKKEMEKLCKKEYWTPQELKIGFILKAELKGIQQGKDEAIEIIKDLEQHHKELGGEINFKFLIKQIKGEKR